MKISLTSSARVTLAFPVAFLEHGRGSTADFADVPVRSRRSRDNNNTRTTEQKVKSNQKKLHRCCERAFGTEAYYTLAITLAQDACHSRNHSRNHSRHARAYLDLPPRKTSHTRERTRRTPHLHKHTTSARSTYNPFGSCLPGP